MPDSSWFPLVARELPYVIVQSYARGKPVIGSLRGGIPEMVQDGESGLLFDPDSAESLANAMAALWSDFELSRMMGRAAKEYADATFNREAFKRELLGGIRGGGPMRVLLIGGSGFIGSHIQDALLARGHIARVLDVSPERHRGEVSGVEYVIGSADDKSTLAEALADMDAVIYLASTTVPSTSNADVPHDISPT